MKQNIINKYNKYNLNNKHGNISTNSRSTKRSSG